MYCVFRLCQIHYYHPISEIESAISHMKEGESAGDDRIISEFLMCGKNEFKHVLYFYLINYMKRGIFLKNGQQV